MTAMLCVLMFMVLFFLGVPVVLALYTPAVIYLLQEGFVIDTIGTKVLYSLSSYTLVAVPLFILVGNMMSNAGVARRIFDFADKMVGRLPGGLAQVNILASLIFAGMSGSALADVGGLGKIEVEEMKAKGFTPSFSAAVTVASSTLGPIFPPSIPMLLFASVASASPVLCLMAGMLPAVLCLILMGILTGIIAVKNHYPRRTERVPFQETWHSFLNAALALVTPILLIIGMLTGIFTPTELSGFAVLCVVIASFLYKDLNITSIKAALTMSVETVASIMMIFPAAALYTMVLTLNRTPETFARFMLGISNDVNVLLLLINIMLLIVGMFMGNTEAILLLVPIIAPLMTRMGINIIHLSIVVVFNLMIGLITPPFAMSIFLGADVAGCSVKDLLRDIWPYFIPLILTLLLITYVPWISMLIPNLIK